MLRSLLPRSIRRVGRHWIDAVPAMWAWRRMLREARSAQEENAQMDRDRVCLLAWYFPPAVTGGTYRPASLVKYGTEAGLKFTVIAAPLYREPAKAGQYLVRQLPSSAEVIRVPPPDLSPLPGAVPDLDGGALNALEVWRAAIEAFSGMRPEFVFATGPPFHTFVAGHLLAEKFGSPLILEYRDEWTECPFDFVQAGPEDRMWEARCLESAWRVIFTTRSQLERHLEVFSGLDRARCVVIPNGWEPRDVPATMVQGGPEQHSRRRTITFTGNLGDHALPGDFLTGVESVVEQRPDLAGRLTIRFVGRRSERAEAQLRNFPFQEMIEVTDQVSKGEASEILRTADTLLLLNPPALSRYIPGKLYEYLAAGPPILVYGDGGEAATLVEQLNAGMVVAGADVPGLGRALERIAADPPDTAGTSERAEWLARHTREELARATVALLESARP